MAIEDESEESLWYLVVAPAIWVAHFAACYATAAIWCAKVVGRDGSLAPVRVAIACYTALALAGIAATLWHGYTRHSFGTAAVPHDFDTRADRHRFLGFATVLLAALSGVATCFVALVAVYVERCH